MFLIDDISWSHLKSTSVFFLLRMNGPMILWIWARTEFFSSCLMMSFTSSLFLTSILRASNMFSKISKLSKRSGWSKSGLVNTTVSCGWLFHNRRWLWSMPGWHLTVFFLISSFKKEIVSHFTIRRSGWKEWKRKLSFPVMEHFCCSRQIGFNPKKARIQRGCVDVGRPEGSWGETKARSCRFGVVFPSAATCFSIWTSSSLGRAGFWSFSDGGPRPRRCSSTRRSRRSTGKENWSVLRILWLSPPPCSNLRG